MESKQNKNLRVQQENFQTKCNTSHNKKLHKSK